LIRRFDRNGDLQDALVFNIGEVSQRERQEIKMSAINGDKARFNRRRRQKISRRQSTLKMLKALAEKHLAAPGLQASSKEKE
jgi:hypothetical protein